MEKRLKIVSSSSPENSFKPFANKGIDRQALQAKFDRLWLIDPQQFDPMRNNVERERVGRTWSLLKRHLDLSGKAIADLGCGAGFFSRKMRDNGAIVHAVDISSNAFKAFKDQGDQQIEKFQAALPKTLLQDDYYDLVFSTELIGHLSTQEERLYFAELSRIVKSSGLVICSTALDINSEGALERFATLAETEFEMIEWVISYHALFIRILNIFKAPERFAKASKDPEYRKIELSKRRSFGRKWFRLNSTLVAGKLWGFFQYLTSPFAKLLEQQPKILIWLEKICRFISADNGISHALFIGRRHPVWKPTPTELLAIEPKHKRQVWE